MQVLVGVRVPGAERGKIGKAGGGGGVGEGEDQGN